MIDFGKLSAQVKMGKTINPAEIFMSLPSKNGKYSYLRNVQAEVLDQWFEQRNNKDTIIKMNTGSGKTIVALLILKSCIAEKGGRAAYVVPDNYLVNQVVTEAADLGLNVTKSEKDTAFLSGEAILVINIQKLFNGKSMFGMRTNGNIQIDYVIIDDVHACVDDVKSQFSIKLDTTEETAKELFQLFKNDLKAQNEKTFLDICDGDYASGSISVPFWRLFNSKSAILAILQKHKNEDNVKFSYPLLGDILEYCNCTFTYSGVEIEPYAVPIHKISAFLNAERRIFMSATLCDDTQLVSVFDINRDIDVITPKYAADIGDRMILFPQAYSPHITDEEVLRKLLEYAQKYNVVVIVASSYRAEFWRDATHNIYTAINILDGISTIRAAKSGLYIFVNKYDGIDLPDDACRIIVLDGLPDARSALDKLNEDYLQGTINGIHEKIQKIEQGMGRGVRSNKDYCGIIIMGNALIQVLFSKGATSYFSEATRKQYEVSSILAKDLKGKDIDEIFAVLDYCVEQNPEWVKLSKGALSELYYNKTLKIDETMAIKRLANNNAVLYGRNDLAKQVICDLVNRTQDTILKGYLMLEEAKYCQFTNPIEAQQILAAAQQYNHHILKPIAGVKSYNDLRKIKPQAQQILDVYSDVDVNSYIIELNAAVENLIFAPNSYKAFEKSFMQLGLLLGFGASRPDEEYNIGPDVLWYLGNLKYAIIECKNEATSPEISKDYCGQLLSSMSWFHSEFAPDCTGTAILIYPTNTFSKHASPAADFRIINSETLDQLKTKLKDYCRAISSDGAFRNATKLSQALSSCDLTADKIFLTNSISFVKM
ncbi:MAG: DEAD/DEAH box helicase family protein [Clostridiales bacterium]